MMTRKDFKIIADAMQEVRTIVMADDFFGDRTDVFALCIGKLTTSFMKINPEFNPITFMKAAMLDRNADV